MSDNFSEDPKIVDLNLRMIDRALKGAMKIPEEGMEFASSATKSLGGDSRDDQGYGPSDGESDGGDRADV